MNPEAVVGASENLNHSSPQRILMSFDPRMKFVGTEWLIRPAESTIDSVTTNQWPNKFHLFCAAPAKSSFSKPQRHKEDFKNRPECRGNRDPPPFIRHRNRFQHLAVGFTLTVPDPRWCWRSSRSTAAASGQSQSWLAAASATRRGRRGPNDYEWIRRLLLL